MLPTSACRDRRSWRTSTVRPSSSSATRVSGGVALTRSSFLTGLRNGRPAVPSSVGESAVFDRQDETDPEEGGRDRRTAVRHERQRNPGRRKKPNHHGGVYDHREEQHRADREDEEDAAAVPGDAGERHRAEQQPGEESEHETDPEKSPLFRDHRQDEIRVLDRKEAELALRARAESFPGEPARADRDLRLPHLVSGAENVRLRVQEGTDSRLLVVREDEPADPRQERDRQHERDPGPRGQPAEE